MLSSIAIKLVGVAFSRISPYFFSILAMVVIALAIYTLGHRNGSISTEERYEIAIQEERDRQIKINDEALQKVLIKQKELERLLAERDAEIDEILEEADEDPNAGRVSVGSDSVRRINRVR